MKGKILCLFGLVILVFLTAFGVKQWQKHVIERQDELSRKTVKDLISEANYKGAWSILQTKTAQQVDADWLSLKLDALVGMRNMVLLDSHYAESPHSVYRHEQASLLLGRKFAHQRDTDSFRNLQSRWINQSHDTNLWMSLEIDHDLLSGDTKGAWTKLEAIDQNGLLPSKQLIQRALIRGSTNSLAALEDLNLAISSEPFSPESRSFRGQILESLGELKLARLEYVAAHLAESSNPLWRDQLAEFYRRYQKYDFALSTWTEAAPNESTDYIFLKSAFWRRVVGGVGIKLHENIPVGPFSELADFISNLPSGQFWDQTSFQNLKDQSFLESARQEIYWLSILQFLKNGDELAALNILKSRPFKSAVWEIYLHETLSSVIRYRQTGRFSSSELFSSSRTLNTEGQHTLIHLVVTFLQAESFNSEDVEIDPKLESLLRGPNAYAAVLMASDWREAALVLFSESGDLAFKDYPSWFHYGMGQMIRYNRSKDSALAYLSNFDQSSDVKFLIGELLVGLGETAQAMKIFNQVAQFKSPEGAHAAWFIAIDHLENHHFDKAMEFIQTNPNLNSSVQGLELRAKVAELTDDKKTATKIYQSILDQSAMARQFLADEAFKNKDFQTARKYTVELLEDAPDDLKIMSNLRAIDLEIDQSQ